jgi:hypothetical protein
MAKKDLVLVDDISELDVSDYDLSTTKGMKAYLVARVEEYYTAYGHENIFVNVHQMRGDVCIDPARIGQTYVIHVRYQDDDNKKYIYQMHAMPDPTHFGTTPEAWCEFIDEHVEALETSHRFAYSL